MTHQEIKAIIDGGEYCIKCPSDYAINEKWMKFIMAIGRGYAGDAIGQYYSPRDYSIGGCFHNTPESKTVLTLDQWWSVMGDDKPTRHTIQDLAEGRCAVVNDGLLEELREVLEEAFPEWKGQRYNIGGRFIKKWGEYEGWYCQDTTYLPTQSVKVFIEELRGNQSAAPTAWQPKEGEIVDATFQADWSEYDECGVYLCEHKGWKIVIPQGGNYPIGYKHIRPIQTIPVSIDDLKAAYAEKHNIDVNKITLNP